MLPGQILPAAARHGARYHSDVPQCEWSPIAHASVTEDSHEHVRLHTRQMNIGVVPWGAIGQGALTVR